MRSRLLAASTSAALLTLGLPAFASAQDAPPAPTVDTLQQSVTSLTTAVDSLWVVVGACLVLFMQAGFALLETGLSRSKNAGAVMGKILINMSVAMLMFWISGFALGFGTGNDFLGQHGFFFNATGFPEAVDTVFSASTASVSSLFFFQMAFCAVSLAIVFGSMLDRTKFPAYIAFAVVFCGLIYPIVAHWTWGGGWLFKDGFLDYAGSSIVHLQGALGALAGALVIGPRLGKYRNGKPIPIPGHSIPLAIAGVLILWFGWMGFNGASSLLANGVDFADVLLSTNLAAGAGVLGATLGSLMMFKTIDVSQMGNGAIGGLVAITASCAFIDYWAAVVVGLIAGLLIPIIVVLVERRGIDDPLGALAAHGVSGIWGTLAIGLFGTSARMDPVLVNAVGLDSRSGLLVGGGFGQLWVQFYGIVATMAFTGIACAVLFLAIKYTIGLRVSEEHEANGLDISEHGMFGYPESFIEVPGAQPTSWHSDHPAEPLSEGAASRPATAN
ncbi:MAG: ammonium transporter [Thermoleophilia bacterium]|nr:ammonium transporter [Thermoleophilia bacterium]